MDGRSCIRIVAVCCLAIPVFGFNNVELVEWILKYGEGVQILEPKQSFADFKYKDDTILQINPNETEISTIMAKLEEHLAKEKNKVQETGGSGNTPSDANYLLQLLSKANVRADGDKHTSVDDIMTRLGGSITTGKEELDDIDTNEYSAKENEYKERMYPISSIFDEKPDDDQETGGTTMEGPTEYSKNELEKHAEQEAEQSTVDDADKENDNNDEMVGYYHHYYHHYHPYHHYYHHYHRYHHYYHHYHPYHYHHYYHHPVVYRGRQYRYCHNTGSYYRYCCVTQWFRVHFYSHYHHGLRFRLRACLGARKKYYSPYYYNVLRYKVNGHTLLTRYKRYYADSSYHRCFLYGKTYTCLWLYRSGYKYQCAKITGYLTLGGYKISLYAYMGCVHLPYMGYERETEDTFGTDRSEVLTAKRTEDAMTDTFGLYNEANDRSLNNGRSFDQIHAPLEYEVLPREHGGVEPLRRERTEMPVDGLRFPYHDFRSNNHRFTDLEPKRKFRNEVENTELSYKSPPGGAETDGIKEGDPVQNDGDSRE